MRAILIAAALMTLLGGPAHAKGDDDGVITAGERYARCEKLATRGNKDRALEVCNKVRNFHRDDPVSILASLTIADVYFRNRSFEQARLAYEDFVRLHSRHPKVEFAVWRIGECFFRQGSSWPGRDQAVTRQALRVWDGFEERFPESEYLAEVQTRQVKAQERLARKELQVARFYARRDAWGATRVRAERALARSPSDDVAPDSRLAPMSLTLMARAYFAWGYVEQAQGTRDRLKSTFPEASDLIAKVDRALAQEPGTAPEPVIFLRPYRIPSAGGFSGMAGAGQGGMGMGMPGMGGGMGGMGGGMGGMGM